MRTILISSALVLLLHTAKAQDAPREMTKIIDATYDSKLDKGYRFIDRSNQNTILFAEIEPEVLQEFDLDDDSLIGSTFRIAYKTARYYPVNKDAENSKPFKEELVILNIEDVD